jgi:hypothetical protein
MRTLLLAATLGLCLPTLAINRFVDPNLSTTNGTTLFNSISSAVAAAVDGDTIVITPTIYTEPVLVIAKSLTLLPTDGVSNITFNNNITLTRANNRVITLYRFVQNQYTITAQTAATACYINLRECSNAAININDVSTACRFDLTNCTLGTLTVNAAGVQANRSDLRLIDCSMSGAFSCNADGWDVRIIRGNHGNQTITFRFGDLVQTAAGNINVNNESLAVYQGVVSIIQCAVLEGVNLISDDVAYRVLNNSLRDLRVYSWSYAAGAPLSEFANNEFTTGPSVTFPNNGCTLWEWRVRFVNNIFPSAPNLPAGGDNSVAGWGGCNLTGCDCGGSGVPFSTTNTYIPNFGRSGTFDWSYNSHGLPNGSPAAGNPIVYSEVGNGGANVDGGSPNAAYYDLDLTRNDRGRAGGPFGTANFPPNGSTDKSFIYDLEMPAELFNGVPVNVKAKGYQRY